MHILRCALIGVPFIHALCYCIYGEKRDSEPLKLMLMQTVLLKCVHTMIRTVFRFPQPKGGSNGDGNNSQ